MQTLDLTVERERNSQRDIYKSKVKMEIIDLFFFFKLDLCSVFELSLLFHSGCQLKRSIIYVFDMSVFNIPSTCKYRSVIMFKELTYWKMTCIHINKCQGMIM